MSVVMDESSEEPRVSSPAFFELHPPTSSSLTTPDLSVLMTKLFSEEHLHFILADTSLFHNFSVFINRYKPQYAPTLVKYLTMRKATKAVEYANALARSLRVNFTTKEHYRYSKVGAAALDSRFEEALGKELEFLRCEVLPAYITMGLVNIVQDAIAKDIRGEIGMAREFLGELAEVFCLTDPSIRDNPIIYASEEFHRTTQYGTSYAIDRNCRFLQGPGTDKKTTSRLSQAIVTGQESNETLLNYRRDGSPFINLLMCSPLYDDKGRVRYFIGAQVDVTHLVVGGRGIESFRQLIQATALTPPAPERTTPVTLNARADSAILFNDTLLNLRRKTTEPPPEPLEREKEPTPILGELSQMFSPEEVDTVSRQTRLGIHYTGTGAGNVDDTTSTVHGFGRDSVGLDGRPGPSATGRERRSQPKRFIDPSPPEDGERINLDELAMQVHIGRLDPGLPGVYQDYLLARPYPHLRIIFVSPSMRVPGLLRTPLFSKVGGSASTIQSLYSAFEDGASVTAKVVWLPAGSTSARAGEVRAKQRWMRATPLLGSDDNVGIWMCVFVPVREDDDKKPRSLGMASEIEIDFAKRERRYAQGKGPKDDYDKERSVRSPGRGTSGRTSRTSRDEVMSGMQSPVNQDQMGPSDSIFQLSRPISRSSMTPVQTPRRKTPYDHGEVSERSVSRGRTQPTEQDQSRMMRPPTRERSMYHASLEDVPDAMDEDMEMHADHGASFNTLTSVPVDAEIISPGASRIGSKASGHDLGQAQIDQPGNTDEPPAMEMVVETIEGDDTLPVDVPMSQQEADDDRPIYT